jgi:hypothetical protein
MNKKRPLPPDEISAIVRGFDPVDWTQLELLAKMPPGARYLVMLEKSEQVRIEMQQTLQVQHPQMNAKQINLMALEALSGDKIPEKAWELACA